MAKKISFDLNNDALKLILNLGLNNLQEDRENALEHHDTLSGLLQGTAGAESLSSLEIQMMIQELSGALTNFLNSSSRSTENIIKIAKIISDHLKTMDTTEAEITDEDREMLAEIIDQAKVEGQNIVDIKEAKNGNR